MLDLLEEVDFLEHLPLAKVILHVVLLDGLNRNLLTRELVYTECHFTKGTLTYKFDESIEIQSCGRQLVVLLDVRFNVADELLTLLDNSVIYLCCALTGGAGPI